MSGLSALELSDRFARLVANKGRGENGRHDRSARPDTIGLAPGSRPFTVADLEAMPDDGRRYELIDGMLLVSPAPGWGHQHMMLALARLLHDACPPDMEVLAAPFGVRTALDTEVQPDVLVARFDDLTRKNLPVAPVLAVEVLSPSTQLHDRNLKMAHYARIGVAHYWLADPSEPGSIAAYILGPDAHYAQAGFASGADELVVDTPFPVRVTPARLLGDRRPRD